MEMIAMKNDRFLIVYLTAMEKQARTIMVIFSILCKSCNCKKLIAAYCPGKGIVGQNFDCNFICVHCYYENICIKNKKMFVSPLFIFIYFYLNAANKNGRVTPS